MVVCLQSHKVLGPYHQETTTSEDDSFVAVNIVVATVHQHVCLLRPPSSLKMGAQCGSWALHLLLLAKVCQTSGCELGQAASSVCILAALPVSLLSVSHCVGK